MFLSSSWRGFVFLGLLALCFFAGMGGVQARYSHLVMDANTGKILLGENSQALRHPASLTKMMTLYLAFQALEHGRLRLNQHLPVSEKASVQAPSKLGLHPGQTITVENAILALVTHSANDAAMVLAEGMGRSATSFASMMNRQAHDLGMLRTNYHNPSGLPHPAQKTTAYDQAILASALIQHYPQYYRYFRRTSFDYNGASYANHNKLLGRYAGIDGIKTGYIRSAGFNLVTSVKRGKVHLVGVVFGGKTGKRRDRQMMALLDKGFAKMKLAQNNTAINLASAEPKYVKLPSRIDTVFGDRRVVAMASAMPVPNFAPVAIAPVPAPKPLAFAPLPPSKPQAPSSVFVYRYKPRPAIDLAMADAFAINVGQSSKTVSCRDTLPGRQGLIFASLENTSPNPARIYLAGLNEKTALSACTYFGMRRQTCAVTAYH